MYETNEEFLTARRKEAEPYLRTLVLDTVGELVILTGVDEDEEDNYWTFVKKRGQKSYQSCCGGWIPLKGFIRDKDYEDLVRTWNLNNEEKAV